MTTIAASLNSDSVQKAIVADRQQRWSQAPPAGGISSTTTGKAAEVDLNKNVEGLGRVPFDQLHVEGALKVLVAFVGLEVMQLTLFGKVLGIKVLQKIVRGCRTPKEAAQHGLQVLGLLRQILEQGGQIVPNTEICLACKSHLRLTAYVSILKLCRIPGCALMLTVADHTKLALVTQEQSWEMRNEFFEKLRKYLVECSIPFKFALMFSMAAHEPDIKIT
ncbi:hypothetical protein DFJ73DRAFT_762962 [Zopfochytrium polystomum]|nr:hypothetical protein DFJ73DRAFT_762962 [Zopfochytrium polystomum]